MIHYANPDETVFTGATFTFHFGVYCDTTVVVIQRPGRIEAALETAAECLLEVDPVLFSEPDYADAAREVGVDLPKYTNGLADLDEDLQERIREVAEADHTYTESGWLLSQEWTVDEQPGEPFADPRFDRFDIVMAHATYWASWHQGQGSDGYRQLSRALKMLSTGAGVADKGFDGLSENGQAIYRGLVLQDGR